MKSIFEDVVALAKRLKDDRIQYVLKEIGLSDEDFRERLCFCVFQLVNRHRVPLPASVHAWMVLGGGSNLWVRSYLDLISDGFTTRDVARYLGVTSGEVRRMVRSGELKFRFEGDRYYIDPLSVK